MSTTRIPSLFWLLLSFLTVLVTAIETTQHVDVSLWPLSASSALPFASISYNSTYASISSTSSPSIPADESIVRVGYLHPTSKEWSGVATSATNFGTNKHKTILLHLDKNRALYHIGFKATDPTLSQRKEKTQGGLRAEIVLEKPAPQVQMNKPVVLNADGQVAGPPEQSFLQKYWWAIAIVLVLQVVMSGGGGDEKKS